ncbi:MAG TPA: hypothetical protein VEO00_13605, partial [Actinomycetota bacterium]|nr:hypothetical protein [Actinomycetota bacterium]
MRTLGLVALLVIAGCVAPARSFEAYEGKAANAAEAAVSATRTAGLAAQAATRGDAFGPYVSVVMAEAEDAASGAESAF